MDYSSVDGSLTYSSCMPCTPTAGSVLAHFSNNNVHNNNNSNHNNEQWYVHSHTITWLRVIKNLFLFALDSSEYLASCDQ